MSDLPTDADEWAPAHGEPLSDRKTSTLIRCLGAAACVAVATVLAYVVDQIAPQPNLTLIFVLPVVVSASLLGWTPAVVAVILSVASFDFFFTSPYLSFAMTEPADIWAAALLLAVATIVSVVSAEARRQSQEARRAAARARALQALAHVVIEGRPGPEVNSAAARALNEIFDAPAVIFAEGPKGLLIVATAGGASISTAEQEAAAGVLRSGVHARGESYPYDRSAYDFWPFRTVDGRGGVLGVDFKHSRPGRPSSPDSFIEIVAAYLAAPHPTAGRD